jgi:hypothetical protein
MNLKEALELENSKTVPGEYKGNPFTLEIRTNIITPRFMQQLADVTARPIEMANMLADVLKSWDIDMEGEPFPPTAKNHSIVPIDFLTLVFELITNSITEKEAKAEAANG